MTLLQSLWAVKPRIALTLSAWLVATASAHGASATGSAAAVVAVTVQNRVVGRVSLSLGVTHAHYSLDAWGDAEAVRSGKAILRSVALYQAQAVMGWGTYNPEPAPGHYDWASLDQRLTLIRDTGGIPVITLCCAPDWMKGGAPGETDWSRLEAAPHPDHYADFAALARAVAVRYPDVKHYIVWNELKGFWNTPEHRWDIEGYTELYNLVYDTLKGVAADIKVGGPYVPLAPWWAANPHPSTVSGPYGSLDRQELDAIAYWLQHKHGADFIAVDGSSYPRDPRASGDADLFAGAQFYSDLDGWLRSQTQLPIWWAEWYASHHDAGHALQNALLAVSLLHLARTASVALRWSPQGDASAPYQGDQESLWSDTRHAGGGQPFPFAATAAGFTRCFARGTAVLSSDVSSPDIAVLASRHCVLVVNQTAHDRGVTVDAGGRRSLTLAPYGVVFLRH